ncbi:hypothetical protein FISHEDRAFT_36080 [Fistulina hepatica ATCC 64428]|uniref:Malic enzyme n=1 Tax=Fistulina hepatica ATCC 64428 TaxID=1128425 RepID=A0A0D7AME0_9AGAR|nr:hypothetical protein FISHEDRAFT_36080 [Fistulina hepatica ATCC 64428]
MKKVARVALRGDSILTSPRFNKGTAFTPQERTAFGINARLPYRVNTLDEQCQRAYDQLQVRKEPIRKNTFLHSLKDQNWVLYYALLSRHLRELVPIIYTPTQAEAIANYSHLFRRSEGLYLTFANYDTMEEDFLEEVRGREIDLIVCSDAEAILGIGDQGVGISTAKSAIYTLIGGIDPSRTLPVMLDVGTNNPDLLKDPLYVGWPHERVTGEDYDKFLDKFMQLVRKYFPHSLLHFEDFGLKNAHRLLQKYRPTHAVFNDDIQGTGAVALAGVMAAAGVTRSKLSEQRIIVFGAGTAGLGITTQLRDAMVSIDGISVEEANKRFFLIDRYGLLKESLAAKGLVRKEVTEYVRPDAEWPNHEGDVSLLDVVRQVRPTMLIGCSMQAGAFTESVVRAMAEGTDRPIIFPLSNPGRLVEVDPQDATNWTNGRALLATGSPFPQTSLPGNVEGKKKVVAECNNALVYPGLGFGAMISKSRIMTDTMIIAGAERLASLSPALRDPDDGLLPDFEHAPGVNFEVAVAVAEQAVEEGSAGVNWTKEEVRQRAHELVWKPEYPAYVYDPEGESE